MDVVVGAVVLVLLLCIATALVLDVDPVAAVVLLGLFLASTHLRCKHLRGPAVTKQGARFHAVEMCDKNIRTCAM